MPITLSEEILVDFKLGHRDWKSRALIQDFKALGGDGARCGDWPVARFFTKQPRNGVPRSLDSRTGNHERQASTG